MHRNSPETSDQSQPQKGCGHGDSDDAYGESEQPNGREGNDGARCRQISAGSVDQIVMIMNE
jgi:hypothetical protein